MAAVSPLQLAFLSLRVHEYDDPDRVDHQLLLLLLLLLLLQQHSLVCVFFFCL